MPNYLLPMPNGRVPTIQYINDLSEAGVISPEIANKQIKILQYLQQNKNITEQQKQQIIKQYFNR